MSVWNGYDDYDGTGWFKKLLLVLGAVLGTGFIMNHIADAGKMAVRKRNEEYNRVHFPEEERR